MTTLSDFTANTLTGEEQPLSAYDGNVVLVVNTASECGFTPQYQGLQELHTTYADDGFAVLGFPCNQFGGQEPGSSQEIATFCATNYGITFPIFQKSDVNGPDRNEIYKVLMPISDASGRNGDIQWNFEKFVVSSDGTHITRFSPRTKPDDPTVIAAVEQALPKK